jgi:hypothetical protein
MFERRKCTVSELFRVRAVDMADFIAVKIEISNMYYVYKSRAIRFVTGTVIDEPLFFEMLYASSRPMVLSDNYIDLDKELNKIHRRCR